MSKLIFKSFMVQGCSFNIAR